MIGNRGGRPAKPTSLHKLHNTERARTRKQRTFEPVAEGDLDAPPPWLNKSQREGWQYALEHAPRHLLKMIDRGALTLWVIAEDNLRLATVTQNVLNERSRDLPMLVKSPLGMNTSPYIDIVDRCAKIMFRAIAELGFSPSARPRLKLDAADAPTPENPWAQFKVVTGGRN
jgi:phage terminase small subunit